VILPSLGDVTRARRQLPSILRRTPLVPSTWLAERRGADVRLKLESLQVTGSFKVRGAFTAIAALGDTVASGEATGARRVVTASAGNHGLALAFAASTAGIPCTIFTPADAARTKLAAIERFGADLRPVARTYDEAEWLALEEARSGGATFISPYNHPAIIAGAGTVALEIVEDWPEVEVVVVPVGGGGLVSGVATVLKSVSPAIRVIGVEAAANPAFRTALAHGAITPIEVRPTIADGLGGNLEPGTITFEVVRRLVDDVVAVEEEELAGAIRGLAAHEHLIAEGAGAAAVAGILAGVAGPPSRRAVALLTGGNIDLSRFASLLTPFSAAAPA
jgi:threonine dehydratase